MIPKEILALAAGGVIALQAGLNSSLGRQLGSPLFATAAAFGTGFVFAAVASLAYARAVAVPSTHGVPPYLWFAGGLLGAVALASFYWLIPRLGIATTLSFALTGQLLVAMVAGHCGWFGLPPTPLSNIRLIGAVTLVVGILLINRN